MLITVIVPIYNMEAYLCTSLDRLLQQSFQDYEILLIDDGSKDSSGEICDRYAREHSRIRALHEQHDASLNFGFRTHIILAKIERDILSGDAETAQRSKKNVQNTRYLRGYKKQKTMSFLSTHTCASLAR